jgi:6,7-dimethyl-8-ribityllumazine synthase
LANGALDALLKHGVQFDDIDVVWVPGAWELPIAVRRAVSTERYDVIVALGAVIRGGTPHFDYVAGETSRALMQAGIDGDVPLGFGLLTCDNMEQAEERTGGAHGNKGWDAAVAALETADVLDQMEPVDAG